MAEANKASFLESINPWSRSSTPPPVPKSPMQIPKDDGLKPSAGLDHSVSLRPSPSLRRYPRDCPALTAKWYYAVDVAKRKPFVSELSTDDQTKVSPVPKKWVPFSTSDSQAIEDAFLNLDRSPKNNAPNSSASPTSTKVPVNEDYLFDVHIERRELEPAYWLGPIYEVRRGSWFYQEGSVLRACDENLAKQLEEGYLKVAPWRRSPGTNRSVSQPRSRPTSMLMDQVKVEGSTAGTTTPVDKPNAEGEPTSQNTYRLFGAHMNTIVTYQDATTAFMSADDLMSRIGSTVYGRFGGYSGTKVVRGWYDDSKTPTTTTTDPKTTDATKEKRRSGRIASDSVNLEEQQGRSAEGENSEPAQAPKRSALERQLSSLAGLPSMQDSEKLAEEEAREEEEKEMEDAREKDGDDQNREIDHLVLVTHGIGQRLGLRLDSINFVHDVNVMRKTMKAVYETGPDLQALSGDQKNCKIQILPICWRHKLHFPKQRLKMNRKEFDMGDMDSGFDDEYPSLQDITVEGVPAVRNLITDLAMDVLLYQSAYREHIASIVQKECNRVVKLFKQRTGFHGKVSLCGHSLGSAVLFDILCRQEDATKNRPRRVSNKTNREFGADLGDLRLDFEVENFFCLGSPIALFQMLKGRTITGRKSSGDQEYPLSPFDPDHVQDNPFDSSGAGSGTEIPQNLIPLTTSSPKCNEFYNIFHPADPIAYRIEPLISPAMVQLKPQQLPYTKKGLFAAPGIANISARVGQQVMSSWYSITSGVASSLINRSLGITGEEQVLPLERAKPAATTPAQAPLTGQAQNQSNASTAAPAAAQDLSLADLPNSNIKKQQAIADLANQSNDSETVPTLIDSEIETLYLGFQKQIKTSPTTNDGSSSNEKRASIVSNASANPETSTSTSTANALPGTSPTLSQSHSTTSQNTASADAEAELQAEKARKLRREAAKVKLLNSNGRVDYSIQEGMFDVSLLASIASHLSYWADEDVHHFIIGQMLKQGVLDRKRSESEFELPTSIVEKKGFEGIDIGGESDSGSKSSRI